MATFAQFSDLISAGLTPTVTFATGTAERVAVGIVFYAEGAPIVGGTATLSRTCEIAGTSPSGDAVTHALPAVALGTVDDTLDPLQFDIPEAMDTIDVSLSALTGPVGYTDYRLFMVRCR